MAALPRVPHQLGEAHDGAELSPYAPQPSQEQRRVIDGVSVQPFCVPRAEPLISPNYEATLLRSYWPPLRVVGRSIAT